MTSSWERAALSWSTCALPVLSGAAAGSRQSAEQGPAAQPPRDWTGVWLLSSSSSPLDVRG